MAVPQAVATKASLSLPDVPKDGDKFVLVFEDDTLLVGIDVNSLRDDADGATSAVVYMRVAPKYQKTVDGKMAVAIAGRAAVKCASQQWRLVDSYILDDHNQVIATRPATEYKQVQEGEVIEKVAEFLCNTQHPASVNKGIM